MKSSTENSDEEEAGDSIREVAARWVIRRERGLSASETADFELWLAADSRHASAMECSAAIWNLLDETAGPSGASETRPGSTRRWWPFYTLGGLAAALVFLFWVSQTDRFAGADHVQSQILSDGTIVRLNIGGAITEEFTAAERHVRLRSGEAHFSVTKNTARPFFVHARTVEIRAVGTAFDVNLQPDSVAVLVTEGKVRVDPRADPNRPEAVGYATRQGSDLAGAAAPILSAGQRGLVPTGQLTETKVAITEVTADEISQTLAWERSLMRLGGATLAELTVEFERHTGKHLLITDPLLADMHIGGRFWTDDVEGFIETLQQNYGVTVERRSNGDIILKKTP